LRYFNIYGPRQSCNLNAQYGGVIIIFLNRLLKDLSPIIYGDGEQTRDFVNVYDIIQSNILAMNSPNAPGQSFNIGSGTQITVNQVAKTLKVFLKKNNIENEYVDARPGDVKHGFADISKAGKFVDYETKVSFDGGISYLVEWHVGNKKQ
jgi:nucleoside-diphosphate-sugar epimerase